MAIFYGMHNMIHNIEERIEERGITFSFEYAANIKYEKQGFLFLFHRFNMRRLKIHESD